MAGLRERLVHSSAKGRVGGGMAVVGGEVVPERPEGGCNAAAGISIDLLGREARGGGAETYVEGMGKIWQRSAPWQMECGNDCVGCCAGLLHDGLPESVRRASRVRQDTRSEVGEDLAVVPVRSLVTGRWPLAGTTAP